MTNQELLELAAKAAGIAWQSYHWTKGLCLSPVQNTMYITAYWNPLIDDSDALRLAVKLKLMVSVGGVLLDGVHVQSTGDITEVAKEPYGDDPYAATRRAIVRAAAAIGGQP